MKPIGQYDYRVEPQDVDFTLHATLAALGNCVLNAAGEDADRNGFGVRTLNTRNASWVLTRMAIEMERLPRQYEGFAVHTWVYDVGRAVTTRCMEIVSAGGERLGGAVTLWAVIDLEARRPLDLRELLDYEGIVRPDLKPGIAPPARLAGLSEPGLKGRHRVVYSDIDFNRHANSMKYVQWILDLLPVERLAGSMPARVEINYLHEARLGQELAIAGCDGADRSEFEVTGPDGTVLCRTRIVWR